MPLPKCQLVVTDEQGNIVDGASIEVRSEVSGQPLVSLYSDRDATVALGNPFVAAAGADAGFFCAEGEVQIVATKGGFTRTSRYVPVFLTPIARRAQRIVTAAGDVQALATDQTLLINKTVGAPTVVYLPSAAALLGETMRIVDRKGDAGANPIAVKPLRAATVTITIANPGVVTWNAHGLAANAPVIFTTTGALPTGLAADTVYFVKNPAANTFEVSATPGGASITTSGSQSGVHSAARDLVLGRALYTIDSNGSSLELEAMDGGWW